MDVYQHHAGLLWECDGGDEHCRKPLLFNRAFELQQGASPQTPSLVHYGIRWSYMSITAFKEYHGKGVNYWPHRELQEEHGVYVCKLSVQSKPYACRMTVL